MRIVNILDFMEKEAKSSAEIRMNLEKKDIPIGLIDIVIDGTALANRGILVSHKVKEFKQIKNLQVVDWY